MPVPPGQRAGDKFDPVNSGRKRASRKRRHQHVAFDCSNIAVFNDKLARAVADGQALLDGISSAPYRGAVLIKQGCRSGITRFSDGMRVRRDLYCAS
jgi:hypothetical protein